MVANEVDALSNYDRCIESERGMRVVVSVVRLRVDILQGVLPSFHDSCSGREDCARRDVWDLELGVGSNLDARNGEFRW